MLKTYLVTGHSKYRGHAPGEKFVADLEPDVEARALRRKNVEIISEEADWSVYAASGDDKPEGAAEEPQKSRKPRRSPRVGDGGGR